LTFVRKSQSSFPIPISNLTSAGPADGN